MKTEKKTYSQILDAVAGDYIHEGLDLAPHILSRIQKGKKTTMQPRLKVFVTVVVILLLLAIGLVSVPAARATIQRWFGYVPGFGLVPDGGIRVLAEPASVTRAGITMKVEEAILSSDKTIVRYALQGISAGMLLELETCPMDQKQPAMRLPDGSELELRRFSSTNNPSEPYWSEVIFSAMPAGTNAAKLVIACLPRLNPGAVPQDWEVPLRFAPAPSAMLVAPVQDVQGSTQPSASLPGLKITKIIPTQDGYILAGTITVSAPAGYTVDELDGYLENVTITDKNGQAVVYGPAPTDFVPEELASQPEGAFGWASQISSAAFNWPLTMTVHSVTTVTALYPPAEFQFDAGLDAQVNQVWTLNQDVVMGPKTVHVVSVSRVQKGYGFDGYEFTFTYDPSMGFSLEIQGHTAMGGGGSGGGGDLGGNFTRALAYPEGIPSGTLTVVLHGYGIVQLPGPWQVTWDAPTSGVITPAP